MKKLNQININGETFALGKKIEVTNCNGGDYPETKTILGERKYQPEPFLDGVWKDEEIEIIEKDGSRFVVESFNHFNGHFSGYKENIYEVYGRKMKKEA